MEKIFVDGHGWCETLYQTYVLEDKSLLQVAKEMGWKSNNYKAREALIACGIPLKPRGPPRGKKNPVHNAIKNGNWKDPAKRVDVQFKISRAKLGSKNAMWKGGRVATTWYRNELRRLGFDLTTCSKCGTGTRRVYVHHIDGDRFNNNTENLSIVCSKYHAELHGRAGVIKKFRCYTCGKRFEDYVSNRRRNRLNFCSVTCHADHLKKHPLKYWLGKRRPEMSTWLKAHPFPKRPKSMVERVCNYCGKHYLTEVYRRKKYCSKSCQSLGNLLHTENWIRHLGVQHENYFSGRTRRMRVLGTSKSESKEISQRKILRSVVCSSR